MLQLAALCSEVLLAGTWLLALTAFLATASTLPTTTVDTPGPQTYTVPGTDQYEITAFSAQGGGGGLGAEIQGQFALTAGETLSIYVGGPGAGGVASSGGGGGGFVVGPGNTPLVIAGGGGFGAGGGGSFLAADATDRMFVAGVHAGDGAFSIAPVVTPQAR